MRHGARQAGQALAETLVVFGCLASLWLAVAWLGRLQDVDLQLLHASRRAAFAYAHQGLTAQALTDEAALELNAAGQRWQTRQGSDLLRTPAWVAVADSPVVPDQQVGDPIRDTGALRAELRLGDIAVARAQAGVQTQGHDAWTDSLRGFDRQALSWRRQTSILRGAGAAQDDEAVQAVLEDSPHAWGRWAQSSLSLGQAMDARLQGVDAAWGRARPVWDWVRPWAAALPEHHLGPGEAP
ncbi:hypothetical protein ACMHYJ_03480 [Castellaniella hirudinis]|uniref:hypothetical protein n=1 Tax=Castellaniella hirudinis TaxID=1144617 RepID=UPI0039C2F5E6